VTGPKSRSPRGSEKVRSGWPQAVDAVGPRRNRGRVSEFGFGMGSVGSGGSVGQAEICSRSSAYSRRTGLSELLKIRVSMVRFRPWPPIPTRGFATDSGYYPRTVWGQCWQTRGLSGSGWVVQGPAAGLFRRGGGGRSLGVVIPGHDLRAIRGPTDAEAFMKILVYHPST